MAFANIRVKRGAWGFRELAVPSAELPAGVCSQCPLALGLHRAATGTRGHVRARA